MTRGTCVSFPILVEKSRLGVHLAVMATTEASAVSASSMQNDSSPAEVCIRDMLGDTTFLSFQISTVLLMAALCIVGNSLVIYLMSRESSLDSPMKSFIVSLAVSDLLHGVFYGLYTLSHVNDDDIRRILGMQQLFFTI